MQPRRMYATQDKDQPNRSSAKATSHLRRVDHLFCEEPDDRVAAQKASMGVQEGADRVRLRSTACLPFTIQPLTRNQRNGKSADPAMRCRLDGELRKLCDAPSSKKKIPRPAARFFPLHIMGRGCYMPSLPNNTGARICPRANPHSATLQ